MLITDARLLAGVCLLCLGACATPPQTLQVQHSHAPALPRHVELAKVPYFAQDAYQCGPASLAMSLNASGISVSPDTLTPELYLPGRHGSLQVEMLAAARRHGAVAYQLAPELIDMMREIASGTPVIVMQNLAFSWYPVWHYAVAIGYDLDKTAIILRSGPEQRQLLPMSTFEYTWARSGYWAIVTLPPGNIPATADENAFVSAASAFERINGPDAALPAYSAATERWPKNLAARIGLGNTAYKLHDLKEAESAFRQAARDHPDSVAALNNLAQTLADESRYQEALDAAKAAVRLGGPFSQTAQETLAGIRRTMQNRTNQHAE
jgi:tetratricopeptide (TPR) repeat protein